MKSLPLIVLVAASGAVLAQAPETSTDGLDLARLKTYSASRTASENRYVLSNEDAKHLMPGETLVIADLKGPGVVSHIWFTAAGNEFSWPRLFRLRAYYDGRKTPSVDAPLGDFFGVGNGYEADLNSNMVRNTSIGRARNSYWPMPFRQSCRITVTNEGARMKSLYYQVDWRQYASLPAGIAYFHAYYRQERPAVSGRNYSFLNIRGKGHYVGTVLSILQTQISWFGEGDDLFYVDGATHPQIYGTGSEDYFNEAWGLRESSGPWTGSPVAEGERIGSRLTGYRWHVPDPIPFTQSLWAGIEHRGWTYNPDGTARTAFEERPDYFSSVAFWYQEGVNEDLPEPPYGDARLPAGNAQQIPSAGAIDAVTTAKGKASVQHAVDLGKDLLFLAAEGPGATMDIPFDVPDSGRYEVVAEVAKAPNYGNYIAFLDGQGTNLDLRKPESSEIPFPGPVVFHNYEPEVYVAVQRPLGFFRFDQGRHILRLECVGKDVSAAGYDVGVYDVVLERLPDNVGEPETAALQVAPPAPDVAPPVAAGTVVFRGRPLSFHLDALRHASAAQRPDVIRAIGAFGADAAPVVAQVAAALNDADVPARIAAAWALSQIGAAGSSAVPSLGGALSDPSPQVRVLAALALKSMGPAAAPAVPQLVRALDDSAEDTRVTAAGALGSMGSDARAAVQPLTDKLLATDEVRSVLTAVATALGDIGPDAKSALPVLERAVKSRGIGPAAQEAILRIQGKPVPTWW